MSTIDLESDNYAHLHSDTFVRGYLRAYAILLKLDVARIFSAYERQLQRQGNKKPALAAPVSAPTGNNVWRFVAAILLGLLLLWLVSVWFFEQRKEPAYKLPPAVLALPEAMPAEVAVPLSLSQEATDTVLENAASENVAGDANENETAVPVTEAGEAPSSAAASAPAVATASPLGSPVAALALDELQLRFTAECWLEVSDAQGDVLATELHQAGAAITLRGRAPFAVVLGNARAAELRLNGEPVAFTLPVAGNVLNLQVGSR